MLHDWLFSLLYEYQLCFACLIQCKDFFPGAWWCVTTCAFKSSKLLFPDVHFCLPACYRVGGGTSWHAAGLVSKLKGSRCESAIACYSAQLYNELEREDCHTGIDKHVFFWVNCFGCKLTNAFGEIAVFFFDALFSAIMALIICCMILLVFKQRGRNGPYGIMYVLSLSSSLSLWREKQTPVPPPPANSARILFRP